MPTVRSRARVVVLSHTLAGAALGVLFLHPITMAIYWFEFHPGTASGAALVTFVAERTQAAFAPRMLPMTGVFAMLGGAIGLASGLDTRALLDKSRVIGRLASHLAEDVPQLIPGGESDSVEFKASLRWDYKQSKVNKELEAVILKTLAGFMNQCGGNLLILQPTRVVARKGIEHAIELVRLLNDPRAKLVITHSSGDEGEGYAQHVRRFANMLDVNVLFVDKHIADHRGTDAEGRPLFTINDVYPQADLVTYPSTYEAFGNAFLEAVYYRCPVVCNRYAVFRTDIEPCGFHIIQLNGYLTDDVVDQVRRLLHDRLHRQQMAEHNFEIARTFFSYSIVEHELRSVFCRPQVACRCGTGACCTANENAEGISCHCDPDADEVRLSQAKGS